MYKTNVGLEVHVELNTESKMFCSCRNNPEAGIPNSEICPICLGHPGTLPVINQEAVRKVIKTGLALNCQIPEYSKFDRKNYFYPDLPKGYQISQYDKPLCLNGYLKLKERKIKINRIHLEEDTGKLIHSRERGEAERSVADECESIHRAKDTDYSLVDFNRAGVPLMELVTEPNIYSAKGARKFAEELQIILRYLGVSIADMEKGQMRVEVNISLTKTEKLGTKVEIKNLNSFRVVEKGIDYEIKRQTEILSGGKKVIQETRGWDDIKEITFSQRKKEESHDYRYFPEPDLPPLSFNDKYIQDIKAEIPELPQNRRVRLKDEYQLRESDIEIFVFNKSLGEYFEKVISELPPRIKRGDLLRQIKLSSNYIISDLQGLLKERKILISDKNFKITPENFAEFILLIYKKEISSKIAKMILEEMFKTGVDPFYIIKEKGLVQITDEGEIEKIIKEVIFKNKKAVVDYKKGKVNAFQFLTGQIMAVSKGKANLEILQESLTKFLKNV